MCKKKILKLLESSNYEDIVIAVNIAYCTLTAEDFNAFFYWRPIRRLSEDPWVYFQAHGYIYRISNHVIWRTERSHDKLILSNLIEITI